MRGVFGLLVVFLLFGCDAIFGDEEEQITDDLTVIVIAMAEVCVADTLNTGCHKFLGAEVTFEATQTDGQSASLTGLLDEGGKIGGIGGVFDMYEGQELVLSLEVHSGEIPSSSGGGPYVPEEWVILSSSGAKLSWPIPPGYQGGDYVWDPKVDFILTRQSPASSEG
jgi:hypothetical protein